MEERAEKRLEIFKNLINKMATSASDSDAQEMVKKKLCKYLHINIGNCPLNLMYNSKSNTSTLWFTVLHFGYNNGSVKCDYSQAFTFLLA